MGTSPRDSLRCVLPSSPARSPRCKSIGNSGFKIFVEEPTGIIGFLDIFGAGLVGYACFLTGVDDDVDWLRLCNGVMRFVTCCHKI